MEANQDLGEITVNCIKITKSRFNL